MRLIDVERRVGRHSLGEDIGGHLELGDEVLHEPVGVGAVAEPEVTLALHVDLDSLRLEQGNVLARHTVRAHLVVCGREEGDGHLLDFAHIHQRHLGFSSQPVRRKLLEAVREAVHDPVLLAFDGLALVARLLGVEVADGAREVRADGLQVLIPVRAVDGVDAHGLELHNG